MDSLCSILPTSAFPLPNSISYINLCFLSSDICLLTSVICHLFAMHHALSAMPSLSPFRLPHSHFPLPPSDFSFHCPIQLKLLVQCLAGYTQSAGGFTLIAAAGFKGV